MNGAVWAYNNGADHMSIEESLTEILDCLAIVKENTEVNIALNSMSALGSCGCQNECSCAAQTSSCSCSGGSCNCNG